MKLNDLLEAYPQQRYSDNYINWYQNGYDSYHEGKLLQNIKTLKEEGIHPRSIQDFIKGWLAAGEEHKHTEDRLLKSFNKQGRGSSSPARDASQ